MQLDFGVTAFPGANRFLEISVRPNGGSFATLSPRQQISSTPYAIRTLSATTADALSTACARCVQDSHINSVAGNKVGGLIPVSSVPGGSTSYVQNTTTQQANTSFNIQGTGFVGTDLQVGNQLHVFGFGEVDAGLGIGTGSPSTAFTYRTSHWRRNSSGSAGRHMTGFGGERRRSDRDRSAWRRS